MKLSWDTDWSPEASLAIIDAFAGLHAELGGSVGADIRRLITDKCYGDLVQYALDLSSPDWDVEHLYHCRQALGFYQKSEWLDIGVDKEQVARQGYYAREAKNKEVNDRFRGYRLSGNVPEHRVPLIMGVRNEVGRILGRCPEISDLKCGFGPGATLGTKKVDANPLNKMRGPLTCSAELYHSGLLPSLLREYPQWFDHRTTHWSIDDEDFVVGELTLELENSRLSFVDKNAKTKRSIDIQSVICSFLQTGIGVEMKGLLLREGVDISDQTRNQRLAWMGSRLAGLGGLSGVQISTLDLKDASNSKCYEVVKTILDDRWFELLSIARHGTTYDSKLKKVHRLQMFSAMGNGFTFPLETLLFYAICKVVCTCHEYISVYGDDIIVAESDVPAVIDALNFFGFEVNTEKSFVEGPFRESCGADFYRGSPVRPYYQKRLISVETLFTLHNFYKRRGLDVFAAGVKNLVPVKFRTYGPDGYGDGHLISDTWKEQKRPKIACIQYTKFPVVSKYQTYVDPDGWEGSWFATYSKIPRSMENPCHGDLATPLYGLESRKAFRPGIAEENTHNSRTLQWSRVLGTWEVSSLPTSFSPTGRPLWPLPGNTGVRLIKVYTPLRSL